MTNINFTILIWKSDKTKKKKKKNPREGGEFDFHMDTLNVQ